VATRQDCDRRWDFLAARPRSHQEDGVLYVHASPRAPLTEYVFPEDVHNGRKMEQIFAQIDRCCFVGHTHAPGVFAGVGKFLTPAGEDFTYRLNGPKVLCNVGSVGQPRDGDWRACYVLFDGETIRYRRVPYDV